MSNIIHVVGDNSERGAALGRIWYDDLRIAFEKWSGHFAELGHDPIAIAHRLVES